QLADIVLSQPALRTVTGPRRHFSFAAFSRLPTAAAATRHAAAAAAAAPSSVASGTPPAVTAVFNSFENNRSHGQANRPNTYLTLLHSVLHYGGSGSFAALSDTIHRLVASRELCSDTQLLYLCATVGPILYRLVDHSQIYVQILADLISAMAQICPCVATTAELDAYASTDALEQAMDFFCFAKDQFDPGRAAWRRIAPHIAALPPLLRYQLQCVVDQ
ncbi:hypothetical protein IWQ56_003337, partial [Coemansia nantahalensis]